MTPAEFTAAAIKLYGRKAWMGKLAKDLGIDRSTVYRISLREQVPGPVEVAIKGMLQAARANEIIDRDARKQERKLPKGYMSWNKRSRKK